MAIAAGLRDWLPRILPASQPWLAHEDLPAGATWIDEIGQALETSEFGILCLTRENLVEPWLHFEAGALAKSPGMGRGGVCPYLLDMGPEQLGGGPLAQFQVKAATRDGTLGLVRSIHDRMDSSALSREELEHAFDLGWDRLERLLNRIREEPSQEGLSPRERAIEALAKDAEIILMEDFVHAESQLGEGDSVLLFSNDLTYDRRYFTEVIAENLRRGVSYLYLLNGADAEAMRNWDLFIDELHTRGVPRLPERRRIQVAPLFWTTAIYEFRNGHREVEAISILEHRFESRACVRLSTAIARQMRRKFLEYWAVAEAP